jgi:UDP-N-acetylglucosamine 4,6-dehydratase
MSAFDNATLMITGGTGSFGSTVLKHFLNSDIKEIRIFSRDEKNKMICVMNFRPNIPKTPRK